MAETDLILAAQSTAVEPAMVEGQVGPLTMNLDGRLRVSTKPGYFAPITGSLLNAGNTLNVDVKDASNLVLHIKNTGTANMLAGAFAFEGSVDSTDGNDGTWFTVQAVRSDTNTIESGRAASALVAATGQTYAWELSVNGLRWFRVRCTSNITSASIATWTAIRGTYATEPIPAIQSHPVTGSGTFTVAGGVTATPATGSPLVVVSAASTNASVQKASAGSLFEIGAYNPTGSVAFLKLYNKASAPTVGSDVPIITIPIPANGEMVPREFGAIGKRFLAGIAMAITGAAAATDTTAVGAGIQVSGTYL